MGSLSSSFIDEEMEAQRGSLWQSWDSNPGDSKAWTLVSCCLSDAIMSRIRKSYGSY